MTLKATRIEDTSMEATLAFYPALNTVDQGQVIFTLLIAGKEYDLAGYIHHVEGDGFLLANDPNFLAKEHYDAAFDIAKAVYEGTQDEGVYTFGNVNVFVLELE